MKYSFKICFISWFVFLLAFLTFGTVVACDDYDGLQADSLNYDVILLPKPCASPRDSSSSSSSSSSDSDEKEEIHLQQNKHFHEHSHHHVHVNLPSSEESSRSVHYQYMDIPEVRIPCDKPKEDLEYEVDDEEDYLDIAGKGNSWFYPNSPEEELVDIKIKPKKPHRKLDLSRERSSSESSLEHHRPRLDIMSCLINDDMGFLNKHIHSLEEQGISETDLGHLMKHLQVKRRHGFPNKDLTYEDTEY